MLLWGIWQGKGKPPFNAFFDPFTSEMNKLYNEGELVMYRDVCKTFNVIFLSENSLEITFGALNFK